MFIHVLVFENNSQIGSLMLKLRLSHRADYIVYFQAHSSKWFISGETAIICENQFGCLKCAKINNIYSKGKTTLREMICLRGKNTKYHWRMIQLISYIQIYIFWFDNTFWWQFSDFWKIFRFFEILWPETWHLRHWLHVTLETLITLLTIENNNMNNYIVTFE